MDAHPSFLPQTSSTDHSHQHTLTPTTTTTDGSTLSPITDGSTLSSITDGPTLSPITDGPTLSPITDGSTLSDTTITDGSTLSSITNGSTLFPTPTTDGPTLSTSYPSFSSPSPQRMTAVPDLTQLSSSDALHPPPAYSVSRARPSLTSHDDQWWSGGYDLAAKIIVLGDYGVGKSTFLATLGSVKDMGWCRCVAFKPCEYVEMECCKNDKKILIRLMDTGGQERYRSMTSSYFRGAHGCLLMFSVTKEESFNNIVNWYNDLGVYSSPDDSHAISAVVVGNTSSPPESVGRGRSVTAERAFRLAESLNLTYCETHVRDEQTVLCCLTRLVNSIIVSRVRRQSLAITIMPPAIQLKALKAEKRRLKCCRPS